jgi:hypothetical protein
VYFRTGILTEAIMARKRKPEPVVPQEIIVLRLIEVVRRLAGAVEKLAKRHEMLAWDVERLKNKRKGPRA